MIVSDSMLQKVDKLGLWFLKSSRPVYDISDLIYELSVKGYAQLFVRTKFMREIQENVIAKVMKDFLDGASDEDERKWLEKEMSEYKEQGYFYCPKEMNYYMENGYFWCNNVVFIDDFPMICNYHNYIVILEDIYELKYDDENDLSKILQLNHEDAIEYNVTMIIIIKEKDYGPAKDFIENHLFV